LKGISNKLKNKEHTAAAAAKEKQEKNPKTFIKLEDILLKFIHICFLLRTLFSPSPFLPPFQLRAHFCFVYGLFFCYIFLFRCFFYMFSFRFCPIFLPGLAVKKLQANGSAQNSAFVLPLFLCFPGPGILFARHFFSFNCVFGFYGLHSASWGFIFFNGKLSS